MIPASPATPVTVIRPQRGWIALDLHELWAYRELLFYFSWRDIKVRYKQTMLGFAWAIIDPVVNTIIFTLLFAGLAKLETDGLPPSVFYMAGLVIWKYFATTLTMASNSLVNSSGMLSKIYFPRILVPTSTAITGLVDLALGMGALGVLLAALRVMPAATSLLLPLLALMCMATALGVGYLFAALNVRYRDIRNVVPFIVQVWMYVTVIYPFSQLPTQLGAWRYLYALNPMVGVVEGFRWCVLHGHMTPPPVERVIEHLPAVAQAGESFGVRVLSDQTTQVFLCQTIEGAVAPPLALIAIGLPVTLTMLVFGLYYFRRVENQFADII